MVEESGRRHDPNNRLLNTDSEIAPRHSSRAGCARRGPTVKRCRPSFTAPQVRDDPAAAISPGSSSPLSATVLPAKALAGRREYFMDRRFTVLRDMSRALTREPFGGALSPTSGGSTTPSCSLSNGPHAAGVAALWWEDVVASPIPATATTVTARLLANADTSVLAAGVGIADRGVGVVKAPLTSYNRGCGRAHAAPSSAAAGGVRAPEAKCFAVRTTAEGFASRNGGSAQLPLGEAQGDRPCSLIVLGGTVPSWGSHSPSRSFRPAGHHPALARLRGRGVSGGDVRKQRRESSDDAAPA
jgi:hypothetical protein